MEYIIIIFFIIFVLYSYLYEYYDFCKIKNCNSGYYINNNTCSKCEGIVSPDGKKCCTNLSSQGVTSYDNECKAASCTKGYYLDIGSNGVNNGCLFCDKVLSVSGDSCCPITYNTGIATYKKDCYANTCKNGKQPYNNCACDFPNQTTLNNIIKQFLTSYPYYYTNVQVLSATNVFDTFDKFNSTVKAYLNFTNNKTNYNNVKVLFTLKLNKDTCTYEAKSMMNEIDANNYMPGTFY